MIKNLLSATLWAVVSWILIFLTVVIVLFIPSLVYNVALQKIIQLVALPFIAFFCTYMYFRTEKANLKNGVILGIYFLFVGFLLDVFITVPLYAKTYDFFRTWTQWLEYLVFYASVVLTAQYMSKRPHHRN